MDNLWIIYHNWLVVLYNPSEKYELVNWDDEISNIWENEKCSKPPTSEGDIFDQEQTNAII